MKRGRLHPRLSLPTQARILPHENPAGSHTICAFECMSCLLRQVHEAIALATADPWRREAALRQTLRFVDHLEWAESPPILAQRLHAFIRQALEDPDPYAEVKAQLNQRAARLFPIWRRRFHEAFPPLEAAVRLAIVGNLFDVGAKTQLSDTAVLASFEEGLTAPLLGRIEPFSDAIRTARRVLYLADNAGEIVFDRDLLAQLRVGCFAVAVRGGPILNDATLTDAEEAGVAEVGEVIANGSDAPGTVLEDCSPAFRAAFADADLVIGKGQGNFETLAAVNKSTFHLLKVKCSPVAEALRCPVGSLVPHHRSPKV